MKALEDEKQELQDRQQAIELQVQASLEALEKCHNAKVNEVSNTCVHSVLSQEDVLFCSFEKHA